MPTKSYRHVLAHQDIQVPATTKDTGRQCRLSMEAPRRSKKIAVDDARKIILETTAAHLRELTTDSLTLERIAASAGMHKMTVCRAFGSRDKFAQALSKWLREREEKLWRSTLVSIGEIPQRRLQVFFETLSARALDEAQSGWQLHLLASSFPTPDHPVRKELEFHRENFRNLMCRLVEESQISVANVVTDALVLLWDGMQMPLLSIHDRKRNLEALPLLVERLICNRTPVPPSSKSDNCGRHSSISPVNR